MDLLDENMITYDNNRLDQIALMISRNWEFGTVFLSTYWNLLLYLLQSS